MIPEIRIEVLLDDGMRLAVLRDPLGACDGEQPGEIRGPAHDIPLAAGRSRLRLRVASRSSRPIRVSSHYPFWRVNPRLEFDRVAAEGYRLDIAAGASVRWAPGEIKEVDLVAISSESAATPFPSSKG